MARLSPVARIVPLSRRRTVRLLAGAILSAFVLVGTSTLAGAAPSKASTAKISAHLTKTSFKSSQAGSVKLIYKFSATSKSFSYKLTFKKGSKWLTVKSVKKKGTFKGSKSMTVKKVFSGKSVKVGSYRLKLSADGGSKLLSFKVVKAKTPVPPPTGSKPANTALPTISGTTTQGQTLASSNGSWSNSPTSYARQWRRCDSSGVSCSDISGATSGTYVLALADVGKTTRVVVTASNSHGSASATSGQTAVVAGLPPTGSAPVNTSLPTISGTTTQGQTLSVSTGSWDNSPTSYAYQWRRCDSSGVSCTDISGATSGSYTLASADVVSTIRVVVTATNSYGSASATSSQTAGVNGIATAVSAGGSHSCALLTDHTVKCWGENYSGQLGNGTTDNSWTPVQVKDVDGTGILSNVIQISAGISNTCALLTDHTVECWGSNFYGGLGNGTTTDSAIPVYVEGVGGTGTLSNVAQISATGTGHTCALLSDGTIKCWGYNYFGELGNATSSDSSTPVPVSGISNATQISIGGDRSCALLSDHTVKCWGENGVGDLGNGTTDNTSTPVQVKDVGGTGTLSNVAQISTGESHACALLIGGTVECWGANWDGQLGNGTTDNSLTPVQVKDVAGTGALSNVTQISGGEYHSCAVLSDNTVECWGENGVGELGNGTTDNTSTPVRVKDVAGTGTLSNVTQISTGESHTCALSIGGTVECWGDNSWGQLGIGPGPAFHLTPVSVVGLP